MSILDTNSKTERTAEIVDRILRTPSQTAEQLFRSWDRAANDLWSTQGDITPADKLARAGTDAKELIAVSRALTVFLITTLTGKNDDLVAKINARLASIPAFTEHDDGTVTITE